MRPTACRLSGTLDYRHVCLHRHRRRQEGQSLRRSWPFGGTQRKVSISPKRTCRQSPPAATIPTTNDPPPQKKSRHKFPYYPPSTIPSPPLLEFSGIISTRWGVRQFSASSRPVFLISLVFLVYFLQTVELHVFARSARASYRLLELRILPPPPPGPPARSCEQQSGALHTMCCGLLFHRANTSFTVANLSYI